ncbi:MAG TPA: hypothetical protein VHY08_21935 [Bacillota bacterium]|nr:hypothetical protein [Bacillota bacterium]
MKLIKTYIYISCLMILTGVILLGVFLGASLAGKVVKVQNITLGKQENLVKFNISQKGKNSIFLSMQFYCISHELDSEGRGCIYYPIKYILRDNDNQVLFQASEILSSDSEDTFRSHFSYSKTEYFLPTGSFETYNGQILSLTTESNKSFRLHFLMDKDEKYFSEPVYIKIIVKEKVPDLNYLFLYIGIGFLVSGFICATVFKGKNATGIKNK